MSLRLHPVIPVLAAAAACRAPAASRLAAAETPRTDEREAVIEAVERGDYRRARALLAELIVAEDVRRARELLAAGEGEEAMLVLDEALELRPGDRDLLALRGEAAYAMAEAIVSGAVSGGGNPSFFYEDALEHFLRAGSGYARAGDRARAVQLAFAASRAARRIPDPDRALELARAGAERLALLDEPPPIDPPPERVHAEAAFDAYIARARAGQDASELFAETERELGKLLGRRPDDAWAHLQLSNLHEWNGDTAAAIAQIERALALAPEEQALHDRLMTLVPAQRGWPALVQWYEDFAALHPRSGRVQRNAGVAAFFGALDRFDRGDYDIAAFEAAEERFARAQELDPALREDCLGYRAIVRNAIGWCHFNQGDYSAAKESFLSMEDLFPGGLAWRLEERLPDGIAGLGFVIERLSRDPNSVSALDDMVEAAAIADYLFAYRPEDGNHANNAGFFNRDAAVLFEIKSRMARARAAESEDPEERARLEREAERLRERAVELMEKSEAAYRVAARLLPDDVRVINDAALVIVYYTRDDVEEAERLLLRAIELGEAQLAEGRLSEEARYALNEAWGDAHQNLAILELTLRRNGAEARRWMEKALAIGPDSRQRLRPLLEVCDAVAADPELDLATVPMIRNMVWLHAPRR